MGVGGYVYLKISSNSFTLNIKSYNRNQVLAMHYFKTILLIMLIVVSLPMMGQRKQISQARDYIKSGSNLDKAETLMTDLLKDSVNKHNLKIWTTLFEAIKKQYDQGNEKFYLKEKYDTAALFNSTRKMFLVLEAMDSIDALPNKKGEIKPKYRNKHSEYLNLYRPNLYNGGIYNVNKKKYSLAFDFFKDYIDCAQQPLFSSYKYSETDKRLPQAAYWASYCGYKENNPDKTLKYLNIAMTDTSKVNFLLQFKCEMLQLRGDTIGYVNSLMEGFNHSPSSTFFFPRLADYYIRHDMIDSAMLVTNRALEIDGTNVIYRYTKSTLLLNTGRYEECIDICKDLVSKNDSLTDAFYNLGLAYFNMAIELDKSKQKHSTTKIKIQQNYANSRLYMERYRQLAPEREDKWATILYTIYLNLNLGNEFDEIDKLLKKRTRK